MKALRDKKRGCPWDRAQTMDSLVPHTLEEAYEVADAIEKQDYAALRDELGDLLFQIVFYARLAEEQGLFDFEDIACGIGEKLTRRHPHVFGDAHITNPEQQTLAWEAIKAEERAENHVTTHSLAGVALALPSLTRAAKLQRRAALVGFDWADIGPVFDKVREELDEVRDELHDATSPARLEEEVGDLLFACVNLARHAQVDPETALRKSNRKFQQRFATMEQHAPAGRALKDLNPEEWESLWQRAKRAAVGQ